MSRAQRFFTLFVVLGLAGCWLCLAGAAAGQGNPHRSSVVEITLHDTLQRVSAQQFAADLEEANARNPAVILLNFSSPGGLPESAEKIAEHIRGSRAPVIVFVREPFSHVSGEALRVLEAGTLSAAHPETAFLLRNGGAATGAGTLSPAEIDLVRSALEGRPETVRAALTGDGFSTGSAISGSEAARAGLVDISVSTEEKLLARLNDRPLHWPAGSPHTVVLNDARLQNIPMTWRQHLLRALMNPDLTVLLLTLGLLLIYLEFNTPGSILPGAAGVLLVMLAVYALLQMPLRWEGVLLLLLAAVLLLAEAQLRGGALLGVLAVVALVVGLRLLVRGVIPQLEVHWSTALGTGVGFGGITAGLLLLGAKARRAKLRTGADAVLGWLAVAQTPLAPEGEVLVRGELWHARLSGDSYVEAGECVKVQGVSGRVLEVALLPAQASEEVVAV